MPLHHGCFGLAGGQEPAAMALDSKQGTEQRRRVEPREAEPVNAPVPRDQGPGLEIRKQSVVLNGGSHGFTKAQVDWLTLGRRQKNLNAVRAAGLCPDSPPALENARGGNELRPAFFEPVRDADNRGGVVVDGIVDGP